MKVYNTTPISARKAAIYNAANKAQPKQATKLQRIPGTNKFKAVRSTEV